MADPVHKSDSDGGSGHGDGGPPPHDSRVRQAASAGDAVEVRPGTAVTVRMHDVLTQPIDIDAFAQGVPEEACTKGHFANQQGEYLRAVRPEAYERFVQLHPDRYAPFADVSYRATLRRSLDAATLANPDVPPAEALRRMGRAAWSAVLDTMIGRMMFSTLGRNLDLIYRTGARAFEMFEPRGTRVRYHRFGDGAFRYDYRNCFGWLDCYQIGVLESVAIELGHVVSLRVQLEDPYRGSIEVYWR